MTPLLLLAPLWMVFELWQLVVAERYLGIKRIEVNQDPRKLPLGSWKAAVWSLGILFEWLWMATVVFERAARAPALCMLVVSVLGYAFRRVTGLKWTLVILTFEGALRMGMLLSICGILWRSMR